MVGPLECRKYAIDFIDNTKNQTVITSFSKQMGKYTCCRINRMVTILLWQAVRPRTVKMVITNPAKDVRAAY